MTTIYTTDWDTKLQNYGPVRFCELYHEEKSIEMFDIKFGIHFTHPLTDDEYDILRRIHPELIRNEVEKINQPLIVKVLEQLLPNAENLIELTDFLSAQIEFTEQLEETENVKPTNTLVDPEIEQHGQLTEWDWRDNVRTTFDRK